LEWIDGADLLIEKFGQLPTFHDAEVAKIELARNDAKPSLVLWLVYPALAHPRLTQDLEVRLVCSDVADVLLDDFNEQNVLGELRFERGDDNRNTVSLSPLYGVRGKFTCSRVTVHL
jgi:hypothetical protein